MNLMDMKFLFRVMENKYWNKTMVMSVQHCKGCTNGIGYFKMINSAFYTISEKY